ncbi:MAG: hypothetical protein ABI693_25840 [Bryobacteraceae bacterium]
MRQDITSLRCEAAGAAGKPTFMDGGCVPCDDVQIAGPVPVRLRAGQRWLRLAAGRSPVGRQADSYDYCNGTYFGRCADGRTHRRQDHRCPIVAALARRPPSVAEFPREIQFMG